MIQWLTSIEFRYVVFAAIVSTTTLLIALPFWGPRVLRPLRRIQSKVTEVRNSRESCGSDHGCPFQNPGVDELALAMRSRLGPRLTLLYCLDRRLHECFGEWSTEAVSRLFVRFLYALVLLICITVLRNTFGSNAAIASFLKTYNLQNADIGASILYVVLAAMSGIEFLTVLEIRGRYKELESLTQQMLRQLTV